MKQGVGLTWSLAVAVVAVGAAEAVGRDCGGGLLHGYELDRPYGTAVVASVRSSFPAYPFSGGGGGGGIRDA